MKVQPPRPERLEGEVDVLADERLLDDLHREHPLLQLDDAHLAGGVEAAGGDGVSQARPSAAGVSSTSEKP